MKLTSQETATVCHEIGHYIIACLLNKGRFVREIDFDFTEEWIEGHNRYWREYVTGGIIIKDEPVREKELLILFGGCAACAVTGHQDKSIVYADRQKVCALSDNPEERRAYNAMAVEILTPFAGLLDELTEEVKDMIEKEIKADPSRTKFNIPGYDLRQWEKRVKAYGKSDI